MEVGYYGQDRTRRIQREQIQSSWMKAYEPIRHLDPILVVTMLALTAIGLGLILSATTTQTTLTGESDYGFVVKQAIALAGGLVAMVITALLDYRWIRALAPVLYIGSIVLLVVVLIPGIGTEVNGAQRWIDLPGFNLQPSEIAKIAVIIAVAAILHERKGHPGVRTVMACLAVVAIPSALVLLEPDLGSAITLVWLLFVMFLVGGLSWRWLAALLGTGVGLVTFALASGTIKPYQLERLTAFLNQNDPNQSSNALFQLTQSKIAIGSGQVVGQGYRQGTQNINNFIPENHTDFVFSVLGEEFGFVGAVVVIALFVILMWRGLRISVIAKDLFGAVVAAAIVGLLALQVYVNIGMTIGIAPITGVPLPFVSYGGTSLIMWYALVGLLLNIHMRRFR